MSVTGAFTVAARAAARSKGDKEAATQPFSIRLSKAERQALQQSAGAKPLGSYIRERLLGSRPSKAGRRPAIDAAAVGQVLGILGRSRLAASVADLAAAARLGTIALTPEVQAQVQALAAEVTQIRAMLMQALGLPGGAGR